MDKLRIVAETLEPCASVHQVAARHDVYPGLVFTWRRHVRTGKLTARHNPLFLPVQAPGGVPACGLGTAGAIQRSVTPYRD